VYLEWKVFLFRLDYIKFSDAAAEIKLDSTGYINLLRFIHTTNKHNMNNRPEKIGERNKGVIKYYNANGEYTVFNTFNTWIARGLSKAGVRISKDITLTHQLFRELPDSTKIFK
jgi:hypothetical protein